MQTWRWRLKVRDIVKHTELNLGSVMNVDEILPQNTSLLKWEVGKGEGWNDLISHTLLLI